jgi:DNA-binding XRE family transcriptional regulator
MSHKEFIAGISRQYQSSIENERISEDLQSALELLFR